MGFHPSWKPSQRIGPQCLRFCAWWAEQGVRWLQKGWCSCNFPGQLEVQPRVMGQILLKVIEIPEPTLNGDTLCWLVIRMFLMRLLYMSEDILWQMLVWWESPETLSWHTGTQLPNNFTSRGNRFRHKSWSQELQIQHGREHAGKITYLNNSEQFIYEQSWTLTWTWVSRQITLVINIAVL